MTATFQLEQYTCQTQESNLYIQEAKHSGIWNSLAEKAKE